MDTNKRKQVPIFNAAYLAFLYGILTVVGFMLLAYGNNHEALHSYTLRGLAVGIMLAGWVAAYALSRSQHFEYLLPGLLQGLRITPSQLDEREQVERQRIMQKSYGISTVFIALGMAYLIVTGGHILLSWPYIVRVDIFTPWFFRPDRWLLVNIAVLFVVMPSLLAVRAKP